MKGFTDFIMRGNLIDLAVAFIMGGAFAAVVTAFTKMLIDLIGKLFNTPDFSSTSVAGVSVGPFLTALVSFVLIALVVYFFLVKPMVAYKAKKGLIEAEGELAVLSDIRTLLQEQKGKTQA